MSRNITVKRTATVALAVMLSASLAGSAMAGTVFPTSTDEARAAAGQAQHAVSLASRATPASTAPVTGSDEARAAAQRAQHRVAATRTAAEVPAIVTSLDQARGTPAPVEPRALAPADLGLRGASAKPVSLETQAR